MQWRKVDKPDTFHEIYCTLLSISISFFYLIKVSPSVTCCRGVIDSIQSLEKMMIQTCTKSLDDDLRWWWQWVGQNTKWWWCYYQKLLWEINRNLGFCPLEFIPHTVMVMVMVMVVDVVVGHLPKGRTPANKNVFFWAVPEKGGGDPCPNLLTLFPFWPCNCPLYLIIQSFFV